MGWSDKGIERLERGGLMVKEWGMEPGQAEAEVNGWKGQGELVQRAKAVDVGKGWHRDYEQRVRDMWRRMVSAWEKAGVVRDGYWQGWADAVDEVCVIVADADEEIERMRTEIGLLKGRGVRDGLNDVGVRGRLEWLRGKGIAGWLVEGEAE